MSTPELNKVGPENLNDKLGGSIENNGEADDQDLNEQVSPHDRDDDIQNGLNTDPPLAEQEGVDNSPQESEILGDEDRVNETSSTSEEGVTESSQNTIDYSGAENNTPETNKSAVKRTAATSELHEPTECGTQFNTARDVARDLFQVAGDVHIKNSNTDPNSKSEDRQSFYRPWSSAIRDNDPVISDQELSEWSNRLYSERIVLVECQDEQVVTVAVNGMIGRLKNEVKAQCFGIDPDKLDLDEEKCRLDLIIDYPDDLPTDSIVVVDLMRIEERKGQKGQYFKDSIYNISFSWARIVKAQLKDKLFIICIGSPSRVKPKTGIPERKNSFPLWNLDFIEPVLKQSFNDKGQINNLQNKLELIRKQCEWGTWEEFHSKFRQQIENGRLVEHVNRSSESGPQEGELKELIQSSVEELSLHRLVLYIAIYFPGLAPPDFDLVLKRLAYDDVVLVEHYVEKKNKKGNTKLKKKFTQNLVIREWSHGVTGDRVFSECGLHCITEKESGKRIIDFNNPWMTKRLQGHMEGCMPNYVAQMLIRIRGSGLLFEGSQTVRNHVISRVKEMALAYPNNHGEKWLVGIILGIKQGSESNLVGITNFEELLIQLSNNHTFNAIQLYRFSYLIRAMLEDKQLKKTVDAFFNTLIKLKLHSWLRDILKNIRSVQDFDVMGWLQKLLNKGDDEFKDEIINILFQHIVWDETQIYHRLSEIWKWLPREHADYNPKSNIHAVAIALTVEVSSVFAHHHKADSYNGFRKIFPFIDNEDDTLDTIGLEKLVKVLTYPKLTRVTEERMRVHILLMLANWTCNTSGGDFDRFSEQPPILKSIEAQNSRKNKLGDGEQLAIFFFAVLLVEWNAILMGIECEPALDSENFLNILLETVVKGTDILLQRRVVRALASLREFLLESPAIDRTSSKTRRTVKHRRKSIQRLIVSLRELIIRHQK